MRRVIVGQRNIGEHEVGWRPTTREVLHYQRLEAEMEREVRADTGAEELHGQQRRHRDQRGGSRPAQFALSGARIGDERAKSELPAEDDEGDRCGKGEHHQPLRRTRHPKRHENQQVDGNADRESIDDE